MEGYCVKCKAKREMKDVEEKKSKNGRLMACGKCVKCNTKMTKFLPNK